MSAPVFDVNVGTQDTSFAGTITTAITVSATANRFMEAALGNDQADSTTITSLKYATVALTAHALSPLTLTSAGAQQFDLQYLVAPTSGTNNMVLVNSGSFYWSIEYTSYTGVAQTGSFGTETSATHAAAGGASATAQVTVASASGELAYIAAMHGFYDSVFTVQPTTTATASGLTQRGQATNGNSGTSGHATRTCAGDQTGASTVTAGWTLSKDVDWLAFGVSLKPAVSVVAPTVTTSAASSVLATSAVGNGNVTSDGGATITERGCVWALTSNPTTANNKITAAGTTGAYTASMDIGTTGAVLPSTTYHYRAYAINSAGTSYGADTTFTTLAPQNFADSRCIIAQQLHSAQSEAAGWNITMLAALYANLGNIVRTSDGVVTVTLPADFSYSITASETVTPATTAAITQGAHALTGSPAVNVSSGGSVATITSAVLSRDVFHAGGGAPIVITGLTGVTGTPLVTVNGVACTVTGSTTTSLNITMPALSGITLPQYVTLVIDGKTFANFNYLSGNFGQFGHPTTFPLEVSKALVTILGRTGFENNALLSVDGQLDQSTTPTGGSSIAVVGSGVIAPHSGSFCCRQISGQTPDNTVAYGGGWAQTDICSSSGGYGRWHRWWVNIPAATLTSLSANGQMKMFLSRTPGNPFVVVATGPESRDPAQDGANVVAVNNDNLNLHINDNSANPPVSSGSYGVEPTIVGATWHEIMVWEYRDTVAGVGKAKAYWDGKKIADTDFGPPTTTYTGMGSDTTTDVRGVQVGLVYTQNALSYPFTNYLDDILVGDGAPNPQDV